MNNFTDREINLICNLEANQTIAIKQYTADLAFTVRSLARIIAKAHPDVAICQFSQALGLNQIQMQSEGETLTQSNLFPLPQMGQDPMLHYLDCYYQSDADCILIFLDLHKYIQPPNSDRAIESYLRTIGTDVVKSDNYKRLVLIGENVVLPPELIRLIPITEMPLPTADKRTAALSLKLKEIKTETINLNNLTEATAGLTVREIFNQFEHYYKNCVLKGLAIKEEDLIAHFVDYKTKLLKSLKIEVKPPIANLTFGGHGELRTWLNGVREVIKPEARDYGIPFPKGCLLGGVSGVGKTLIAEAIANSWNLPLIKISIPKLKGGLVGESEGNLTKALKLIESVQGVLLIDEVEKCVSGADTDSSGVTGGMLSILLEYMQEQTKHFVILTANNVLKIPAELIRKGRLDEVWFAGLPNLEERQEILQIHFNQPKRVKPEYLGGVKRLIPLLADRTELFSGAELASLVTQGLTNIYLDGRGGMPQSSDFIPLAQNLVPLAKSQSEQHEKVMQWSLKARNTSSYEPNNKTHSTTVSQC